MSLRSISNQSKSSLDKESTDDFSLNSLESFAFDEQSSALSSPSDEIIQTNEYLSKSHAKPARKFLKKSLSLPGHKMSHYCVNSHSTPVASDKRDLQASSAEELNRNSGKT